MIRESTSELAEALVRRTERVFDTLFVSGAPEKFTVRLLNGEAAGARQNA